jgi:hypothetical protein
MHCILNAVTLLDATYSKVREIAVLFEVDLTFEQAAEVKRDNSQTNAVPRTKLHRKNPYTAEGRAATKKARDAAQQG